MISSCTGSRKQNTSKLRGDISPPFVPKSGILGSMERFSFPSSTQLSICEPRCVLTVAQRQCPHGERYLLHCSLVHVDGFVRVAGQQVDLPEHHVGLVVFVYLESRVQVFYSLTETRSESLGRS